MIILNFCLMLHMKLDYFQTLHVALTHGCASMVLILRFYFAEYCFDLKRGFKRVTPSESQFFLKLHLSRNFPFGECESSLFDSAIKPTKFEPKENIDR